MQFEKKDYIIYPAIACVTVGVIYKLYDVYDISRTLKQTNPECA